MRVVTLGALVLIAGGAFFIGTRYAENIDQHEASEPRASTQAAPLSRTRVANCQTMRLNARDWGIKEQDDYRHNCWERFEAENGAVYRLDLGLIQSFAAGATSVVYTDEGGPFNIMNLKRWYFTCEGHFSVMGDSGLGPTTYAPPQSVAAHIGDIICMGAGIDRRHD